MYKLCLTMITKSVQKIKSLSKIETQIWSLKSQCIVHWNFVKIGLTFFALNQKLMGQFLWKLHKLCLTMITKCVQKIKSLSQIETEILSFQTHCGARAGARVRGCAHVRAEKASYRRSFPLLNKRRGNLQRKMQIST